jgi:hypothetical protein
MQNSRQDGRAGNQSGTNWLGWITFGLIAAKIAGVIEMSWPKVLGLVALIWITPFVLLMLIFGIVAASDPNRNKAAGPYAGRWCGSVLYPPPKDQCPDPSTWLYQPPKNPPPPLTENDVQEGQVVSSQNTTTEAAMKLGSVVAVKVIEQTNVGVRVNVIGTELATFIQVNPRDFRVGQQFYAKVVSFDNQTKNIGLQVVWRETEQDRQRKAWQAEAARQEKITQDQYQEKQCELARRADLTGLFWTKRCEKMRLERSFGHAEEEV